MRVYVCLLCAVLLGCEYETNNYYYGDGDASVVTCPATDGGAVDGVGDSEAEMAISIFKQGSKLQGNGQLQLQPAPAAPALGQPWPDIMNTPAGLNAQTFIDLETVDNMPHVVTVSMGYIGPQPGVIVGAGGNYPEIVAILDIGIGGIMIRAEVDFVNGFSFSLACSRLQVHAVHRLLPGSALAPPVPPPTVNVGISVSTGTVAHGRQPQRTLASLVDLAPNANELFSVPPFAKSLRVASLPNNITPTEIVLNVNGLGIENFPIAGFPSADLPLGNDARLINHVNSSLINETDRRLIFELAL